MATHNLCSNIEENILYNLPNLLNTKKNCEDIHEHYIHQSKYYKNSEFTDLHQKNNLFTIMSLNCQSLNSKFQQIQIYMENYANLGCLPSVICLQETWLDHEADTSLFQIKNYTLLSKGKSCSLHGGVAMYIHNQFNYQEMIIDNMSARWDGQFVEISLKNCTANIKKMIIGNIYRPPRNDVMEINSFTNDLTLICDTFDKYKNVILAGDFNINLLNSHLHHHINEYYESILASGYFPALTLPTRLTNNSGTLIDNLFLKTAKKTSFFAGSILNNISDHLPCFLSIELENHINPKISKYIKIFRSLKESITGLKEDLNEISDKLNNLNSPDINTNYDTFNEILQTLHEKHFQYKLVKFNKYKHKKEQWVTNEILKSISKRDKLYRKFKNTSKTSAYYTALKNELQTCNRALKYCIQQAKRTYYESLFDKYKNDTKNTWLCINQILNRKQNKKDYPSSFIIDGKTVENHSIIADEFNKYYSEIGPTLASKIHTTHNTSCMDYMPHIGNLNFKFQPSTPEDVINIINSLKPTNSRGWDQMSNQLLKHIKFELSIPISNLINQSVKTGIFPNRLKMAKIIPIYKKQDRQKLENYRPISLLPSISKVFEKFIHLQLSHYFEYNNLFYSSQYGFRKNHNTEHATIELIDNIIKVLQKNCVPINIYLDMSKAFDTIDHNILLMKLQHYGIKDMALELFRSYITNRTQYVALKDAMSTSLPIHAGVPQGSILGPLLFNIYINDLVHASHIFHPVIFADDVTLQTSLGSLELNKVNKNILQTINSELSKVDIWLKTNKLSLNYAKIKAMIFHMPQKKVDYPLLKIGDRAIEFVSNFNFLGFMLDCHLKWKYHASAVSKKLSKTLGIMNRLKHDLPREALMHIYNSLFLSHINYGLFLWGWKTKPIEKLMKKAVRIISKAPYNAHTSNIFKELGLLNYECTCRLHDYKLCYKLEQQSVPKYLLTEYSQIRDQSLSGYPTRSKKEGFSKLPNIRHEYEKSRLNYRIPFILNKMPNLIKEKTTTHSFIGFKIYAKNFMINSYKDVCSIPNCYVCSSQCS